MDDLHAHVPIDNVKDAHRTQAALVVQECRAARVHEKNAVRPLYGRPVLVAKDNNVWQFLRLVAPRETRLSEAVRTLVNESQSVPLECQDVFRLNAPVPVHRGHRIIVAEGSQHGCDTLQMVEDAGEVDITTVKD